MNRADEEEFAAFVAGRSAALLRTAYMLTGDPHTAQDLLQVALLKTLRHWNRIHDRGSLDAFVRRIMVNERRGWLRKRSSGEVPSGSVLSAADLAGADTSAHVDDSVELEQALATLTARQRATVVLRFYDDLSEVEVANILGCSVGTVKSQTSKALARLRLAVVPIVPRGAN